MILDPNQFDIVSSVPVVDTFDTRGVTIDDKFLDDMIADAQHRQAETGDMPPLIVGHNPDHPVPETEKPPVIGFVRNLRKQRLANSDRNAVHADLWVRKEHKDKLTAYPRRSAEIMPSLKRLDALALLGSTPPERALGLTGSTLKLQREITVDQPAESGGESKGFAEIKDMLTQIMEVVQSLVPHATGEHTGGPADEDAELEKLLAELEQSGGEEKKGAGPKDEDEDEAEEKKGPMKMERQLAALEAKVARAEIKESLLKLQSDGIKVNVDEEVETLVKLDPETRKLMLSRIEKNYPKAPTRETPLGGIAESKASTESKILSKDEREKIVQLSRSKNLSYEVAFAEVTGQSLNSYYGKK